MRPYAEIVASNTMGRNFTFGQVLTATAADATLQLSALGYPGLNFVLGSGDVTYQWYILRQGEKTPIGTPNSRFLSWTVTPAALDLGKALPAGQTLLLEVTDNGTSHASQKPQQLQHPVQCHASDLPAHGEQGIAGSYLAPRKSALASKPGRFPLALPQRDLHGAHACSILGQAAPVPG